MFLFAGRKYAGNLVVRKMIMEETAMEYSTILKQVEDQNKEKTIAGKMFRYSGLILAVDFFSQHLNSEQILEAAFDFINELLTLERSSLFCAHKGLYKLTREKGTGIGTKSIQATEVLKNLAVLHGSILTGKEVIMRYYSEELILSYGIQIVVPIIVDSDLEGFILIPEKTNGIFDDDDYIICEVLMKLFNSAMKNFRTYNELYNINSSLDEKIFNLFAISQSSKALLSELNLDALYSLSIDVFSELTQSSSTGFFLYDEKSERFSLKSYRFIYNSVKKLNIELDLIKSPIIEPNRIIVDLANEQDRNYFNALFNNGIHALTELLPQYLVLLTKDTTLLGFVSLGCPVTGTNYKKSVFELIESLASSTYISISNAKHFRTVNEQKALLQNKLNRLISLNNLTKNINSSNSIEALIDVTINTLRISFGAVKCLLALYDKSRKCFHITSYAGIVSGIDTLFPNQHWNKVMKGRTTSIFEKNELTSFFSEGREIPISDISAALTVPIYMDQSEIEMLGVIIVFEFQNSMISDEENVLTMETIAGHIAPILYSLKIIDEQKVFLVPNYINIFKNDIKKEIIQAEELNLDLCVTIIDSLEKFTFNNTDMAAALKNQFPKVYPMSYHSVFVLSNCSKMNRDTERKQMLELIGMENISVKSYSFRQDFSTYEEFIALF